MITQVNPFSLQFNSAQNETKIAESSLAQEQEEESENTEENSTSYCNQPVYREISHTNQWTSKQDEER